MDFTQADDAIYADVFAPDPFPVPIPKRVLVIGGGPAGLVSLRNLCERGQFERVELVERRDNIGGVWYLDDDELPESLDVAAHNHLWPSPAYKGMVGNVLPKFLSFSGHPFPPFPDEEHRPFPTVAQTHAYLRAFAKPYLDAGQIRLNTEVVRVEEGEWGKGWKVVMRDWSSETERGGKIVEEMWDAVVVAVHWHDNAEWPDTPGLSELRELGLAKHAKVWRGAAGQEGRKCLVVGNANSGNDIAAHLAPVAQTPVYQSIRRPAWPGFPSLPDARIKMVGPVAEYTIDTPDATGVTLESFTARLQDGTVIEHLDAVYIGTGYYPFPNFVKVVKRPQLHSEPGYAYPSPTTSKGPMDEARLSVREYVPIVVEETRPRRIPHLHRLCIYAPNPSLAFVGSVMTYTPFTTADIVSTYVALVFSRRLSIPSSTWDRLEYERNRLDVVKKRREEVGENPTSFLTYSVMSVDEEGYGRELREDVVSVLAELDAVLPVWSAETSKEKNDMFQTKYRSLEWARDHGGGLSGSLEATL